MPTEKFTFESQGGDRLHARLDRPQGPHLATALFAHCFSCGKDLHAARRITRRLTSMGIAVLRFDFTGLGHSDGEFDNATFTPNIPDLIAAATALAARVQPPELLIGHAFAGAALLAAAPGIPSAAALITINAPYVADHPELTFRTAKTGRAEDAIATIPLGQHPLHLTRRFLHDIAPRRLSLATLKPALLVLHTAQTAPDAGAVFAAAPHPKSILCLSGADPLLSDPQDAEFAAQIIATWSARHLALNPPAPPPGAPEGILRVSESDPRGYLQDITSGPGHHLVSDAPLAYGGAHRGPSPYGYLAAGLGACTSMTIRMYARRKGWPLAQVRVEVTHQCVHAQDSKDMSDSSDPPRFIRKIILIGRLNTEQRQRLLQIADRCPVHRTLTASADIATTLA